MARPRGISTGKERLVEAAGRSFRLGGYGGTGIDTVSREAGLTSGAFYAHFGSKANAFRLALVDGLDVLLAGVRRLQAEHGDEWLAHFVTFYLEDRLAVELSEACALPTFTADAARSDEETRAAYEEALLRVVEAVESGFSGADARSHAWFLLGTLSGIAGMARAVSDPTVRREIVEAGKRLAGSASVMALPPRQDEP